MLILHGVNGGKAVGGISGRVIQPRTESKTPNAGILPGIVSGEWLVVNKDIECGKMKLSMKLKSAKVGVNVIGMGGTEMKCA